MDNQALTSYLCNKVDQQSDRRMEELRHSIADSIGLNSSLVSTTLHGAIYSDIVFLHIGDLVIPDEKLVNIQMPRLVTGTLWIPRAKTARDVFWPNIVGGSLYLESIEDLGGPILPGFVGENFIADALSSIKGVIFPQIVMGSFSLASVSLSKDVWRNCLPDIVRGDIYMA